MSVPYVGATAHFRARYAAAFRAHLGRPAESTLNEAYELGRTAIGLGLSVVDLADIHHDVLGEAAAERELDADVIAVAGGFLVESLSAFEIVRRGYLEAREQATLERRRAVMVRRLSNILSDESLTLSVSDREPLSEALQLVAEQTRELLGAARCVVAARVPGKWQSEVRRASTSEEPDEEQGGEAHVVHLRSLGGDDLGSIAVTPTHGRVLTTRDRQIIDHLAEMTSAALERARMYGAES